MNFFREGTDDGVLHKLESSLIDCTFNRSLFTNELEQQWSVKIYNVKLPN